MRRKFLYFKLFDLTEHPKEIEILSALEIQNLVGEVTPIDNIFQLSQQPEVKRIIEKDINLQNALTDSLPRRGRHGYLWIGDNLPDVMRAVSKLSYIKEIFLFQQLLEPEPQFVKEKLKSMTFLEYNIYLWRVYKFWTYSFFLDRTYYIGSSCKTETEIDEMFKIFRDELGKPPGTHIVSDPAQMISNAQDNSLKNLNLDQRHPIESHEDNRWFRALTNSIITAEKSPVFIPFAANGSIVLETVLNGYNAFARDLNPLQVLMANTNGNYPHVDLTEYNRLIVEIQSKIKMLMNASAETQTDLFLYSVEGQFLNFWENERKRLKNLVLNNNLEHLQKYIAATRFLIEASTITKSNILNNIFYVALINLINKALRKREKLAFYESYQQALYDIYLKIYLLRRLNSFFSPDFGSAAVENGNSLVQIHQENSFSGVIAMLPVQVGKNGFERDRLPISVLNLCGAVEKLEYDLVGGKHIKEEYKERLTEEISKQEGFYSKLPKEAHDILSRIELMGKKEEVLRYYLLWRQYFESMTVLYNAVPALAKICLILENPELKVDSFSSEMPSVKVLLKCIEEDESLDVQLLQQFTKHVPQAKSAAKKELTVLIFQKLH